LRPSLQAFLDVVFDVANQQLRHPTSNLIS
jgi:hypothetical protein